jgi:hypothetical protein
MPPGSIAPPANPATVRSRPRRESKKLKLPVLFFIGQCPPENIVMCRMTPAAGPPDPRGKSKRPVSSRRGEFALAWNISFHDT